MDVTLAHLLLEIKDGNSDALIIAVDYCDTIGNDALASRLESLNITIRDYVEAYAFLYSKQVAKATAMKEKEFCTFVRNNHSDRHLMDYLEAALAIEINPVKQKLFELILSPIQFELNLGKAARIRFCSDLMRTPSWWHITIPWRERIEEVRTICHYLSAYKDRAEWSLILSLKSEHLKYD